MRSLADGVVSARMHRQGLWQSSAPDATSVLDSLVAMQGQEFAYALWAVAQRVCPDSRPTHADMLTLFDRGDILRTHVLRTTWHLVRPADVRTLLRLTRPRLRRQLAFYDRRLGLDRPELDRAEQVLAREVAGGRHRTRTQLADALVAAGIDARGQRLGHLMMHAEFDEVLISGVMAGKQLTYAAFDERVPADEHPFDADVALADLAGRYAATRAPVTAKDFAWWASLTVASARAGLEAAGCEREEIGDRAFYRPVRSALEPRDERRHRVELLQGYDELIMSYSESRGVIIPDGHALPALNREVYLHALLIDGVLAGHWRHQLGPGDAVIKLQPIRPWSTAERRAVAAAAQGYGSYLDRPIVLD